ncbi:MAG: GNAT family N-acetyltransferase [Rhodobiaceae bacterium]|nr:GNAT family N-acetyltransferase [Rhodobiaceae bacterium]
MDDRTTHHAAGGVIRRLWVTETPAFREHLARLDGDSRRLRFAGAVSPQYVEAYANDALKRATAVYGWFEGADMRAAAELHGPMFSRTGEAAFSVEPDYQGRGIGTALMGRIVLSARNRGMRHLVVSCLSENSPMQKIVRHHDAEIEFHTGETVGTVHPNFPTGLSMLREAIAESHGLTSAMVGIQMDMLTRYFALAK